MELCVPCPVSTILDGGQAKRLLAKEGQLIARRAPERASGKIRGVPGDTRFANRHVEHRIDLVRKYAVSSHPEAKLRMVQLAAAYGAYPV